LTEVPVIYYLSSRWLWFKQQSIELKFDINTIWYIAIIFTAVEESSSKHSSFRW
jgi:hypothetical protein